MIVKEQLGPTALLKRAEDQFSESLELKQRFVTPQNLETLVLMAERIATSIAQGGKLMLCGNGGSACDAQHLAGELLVRLRPQVNRQPIAALALATDACSITACGNDYGFEQIYARMVEALGKPGDVLLGLSTSGRSQNVIKALECAKSHNIQTFGFLGSDGGPMLGACELSLVVPSFDPNRVQEVHITMGHILMDLIESLVIDVN